MSVRILKSIILTVVFLFNAYPRVGAGQTAFTYKIVDTGAEAFYGNSSAIPEPKPGERFFGQDAHYKINAPSYTDNGDGTITDNVTGLMWQKMVGEKLTLEEALKRAKNLQLGSYHDWRVPTIKELYSLIKFTGRVSGQKAIKPFIDIEYFYQPIGNPHFGEREIDAQTWSSTEYVGRTMRNDETIFGVNFVDGRIKGYPKYKPRTGQLNKMYFRFVRGNISYGKNRFIDNNEGTVADLATGLIWQKGDSMRGMTWESALEYAESLSLDGSDDWRFSARIWFARTGSSLKMPSTPSVNNWRINCSELTV